MATQHKPHVERCLNCGAPTPDAFCSRCGQEAVDIRASLRGHIEDFFSEVFTVESRLPQTLVTLLLRPGELTRTYNEGKRVRYVTPLKTYLFASVAFFVLFSFSNVQTNTIGISGDPQQLRDALDAPSHADLPAFLIPHLRAIADSPRGFEAALVDMTSKVMVALVPIQALLLKMAYLRSRRSYGEHVIYCLHAHAFIYLVGAVSCAIHLLHLPKVGSVLSALGLVWIGAYLIVSARRVYGGSWATTTMKMVFMAAAYGLALGAGLVSTMYLVVLMT